MVSETSEFQVKEVLDFCLLWALVKVLSPEEKSLSGFPEQRVALILLLSLLWLVPWGSSAVLHENAQSGHWWVFKVMLGQGAQEMEGLNTWN